MKKWKHPQLMIISSEVLNIHIKAHMRSIKCERHFFR